MEPYQERVVYERANLAERIEKLKAFIAGDIFTSLSCEEQNRLVKQNIFMGLYLEVLDERIAAF